MRERITASQPREDAAGQQSQGGGESVRSTSGAGPTIRPPLAAAPPPDSPSRQEILAPAGGGPLPNHLRGRMERAFAADFSTIRLHRNNVPARIGARAYTAGQRVVLGPDVNLATPDGQHVLAHELAHTLQQGHGPVPASEGHFPVNTSPILEGQAHIAAAAALSGHPVNMPAGRPVAGPPVVQGVWITGVHNGKVQWDKSPESQDPSHPHFAAHAASSTSTWLDPQDFVEFKQAGKRSRAKYQINNGILQKLAGRDVRHPDDVREFDVDSYREQKNRRQRFKNAQAKTAKFSPEFDHQPSGAAVAKKAGNDAVKEDAATVALYHADHAAGRTFGAKNTDPQIAGDAANLPVAAQQDHEAMMAHFASAGELRPGVIGALRHMARVNAKQHGIPAGHASAAFTQRLQDWAANPNKDQVRQTFDTNRALSTPPPPTHIHFRTKISSKANGAYPAIYNLPHPFADMPYTVTGAPTVAGGMTPAALAAIGSAAAVALPHLSHGASTHTAGKKTGKKAAPKKPKMTMAAKVAKAAKKPKKSTKSKVGKPPAAAKPKLVKATTAQTKKQAKKLFKGQAKKPKPKGTH